MKSLFKKDFSRKEIVRVIKSDSFQFLALINHLVKNISPDSVFSTFFEIIRKLKRKSMITYREIFYSNINEKNKKLFLRGKSLASGVHSKGSIPLSRKQFLVLRLSCLLQRSTIIKRLLRSINRKIIYSSYEKSQVSFKKVSSDSLSYEEIKVNVVHHAKTLCPTKKINKMCAFAHFDKNGSFDLIKPYLEELHNNGFEICLSTTSKYINETSLESIKKYCFLIISRENVGLDFGSWISLLKETNKAGISFNELLLANDSVIGPFTPLKNIFDQIHTSKGSIIGLTENFEVRRHLQSYFLYFKNEVIKHQSFSSFIDNFKFYFSKKKIIWEYEIGLGNHFPAFELNSIFKRDEIIAISLEKNHPLRSPLASSLPENPCIFDWDTLISHFNFPFIKKELLRDDPMTTLRFNNIESITKQENNILTSCYDRFIESLVPEVGIVVATYNPNILFLKKQLLSIKNQSHQKFMCMINDDNSSATKLKAIKSLIQELDDERFILVPHKARLKSYHNFERGLNEAQSYNFEYLALCDQDDIWKEEKLKTLVDILRKNKGALLAHSNAYIIDDKDNKSELSLWALENRHHKSKDFLDLILRNQVTGCTTVFKSKLLKHALPFPPQGEIDFHHDQWLAICAKKFSDILHTSKPLIYYRQHSNNLVGPKPFLDKAFNTRGVREILLNLTRKYRSQNYLYQSLNPACPKQVISCSLLIRRALGPNPNKIHTFICLIGRLLHLAIYLKRYNYVDKIPRMVSNKKDDISMLIFNIASRLKLNLNYRKEGKEIAIFQNNYQENLPQVPGTTPLKTNNDSPDLFEQQAIYDLYDSGLYKKYSYTSLLSPKFFEKTRITGFSVKRVIIENPGYDIYLFNPFLFASACYFDIWEQGDMHHPGLKSIASKTLLDICDLDIRDTEAQRFEKDVFCNYWVGSKYFWDSFIPLSKKFSNHAKRNRETFFHSTDYNNSKTPIYTFFMERLVTSFLCSNPTVKVYSHYLFDRTHFDKQLQNEVLQSFRLKKTLLSKQLNLVNKMALRTFLHKFHSYTVTGEKTFNISKEDSDIARSVVEKLYLSEKPVIHEDMTREMYEYIFSKSNEVIQDQHFIFLNIHVIYQSCKKVIRHKSLDTKAARNDYSKWCQENSIDKIIYPFISENQCYSRSTAKEIIEVQTLS